MKPIFFVLSVLMATLIQAEENTHISNKTDLHDIHPYAFYHLIGGDMLWADTEINVISVNATKYKINKKSKEVSGKTVYYDGKWIGSIDQDDNDDSELDRIKINIKFKVIKKLTNPNYFIVLCSCNTGGNLNSINFMLIKKSFKYYYESGKINKIEVLTCEGHLGQEFPSEFEIKKIENLISQKMIGDAS